MKCESNFKIFNENISLDSTRLKRIEDAISALKIFVNNDKKEKPDDENGIKDLLIEMFLQGSYAIGTCIKPANDDEEFDLDMGLSLNLKKSSENPYKPEDNSKKVLIWLEKRLKENANYRDRIKESKDRCVRVSYTRDFHLDIVPVIPAEHKDGILWIPDRSEGWDKTNPKGFISWCNDKEKESYGCFKRIVKYLKWWRFAIAPKKANINSILLTTLLGNHIVVANTDGESLVEIMESLNSWLQMCDSIPSINNPSLSEENLARDWTESEFKAFQKSFDQATKNSRNALEEKDVAESIKLWQKVFGDKFPSSIDEKDKNGIYISPSASGKKYPREFA